ncbi:MAG: cytochrome c oxidase subunit II [bacterium]|nr:cytochrome c oxidase subunit II [bacterium]MDE0417447.1 cytochrome c oxidase subunit II [bacterium]
MTPFLMVAVLVVAVHAAPALAQETVGLPEDWQWGFQPAASPSMEDIHWLYDVFLFPVMMIISAFVLLLMAYILVRYRRAANPQASGTTHNSLLEVIWTGIPALILIVIAIPSLRLLYDQETLPVAEPDLTIKITGHQWYWSYEYPDYDGLEFDAYILGDDELAEGQPRLLATDTTVVVPTDTYIRLQITSEDVIHAWALPAAGVKMDAVPGRLNEIWMKLEQPGMYYGQCSELCGLNHGYMPIMVEAVSEAEFGTWANEQLAGRGTADDAVVTVAQN